ncbi:hypothetical protein BDN70DRAFT_990498 [Pholiota conissans]|uniref:Uncharacterized protein n=1 Tax=Pholiota conissans TaxID=109636 RepID=A0A9P6CXT7_9AGAR|nr:hypothetical protein BDN70DRAFT_990498 [Pholiota conissans]
MPHPPPSRQHGGFAPYDPRYGMTTHSSVPPQSYGALPAPSTFSFEEQAFNDPFRMGTWPQDDAMDGASLGLPSMCGCGDDCSCPGCIHHSRAAPMPSSSAYSSCNNPGHCGTCLDCTIMTLPPNAILPPNTALSIYDSSEAIDDWLRTMSASIPTDQTSFQQNFFSFQQQQQQQASWNSNTNNVLPNGFGGYNPNQSMMPFNDRSGVPPHTRHRSMPSDDINIDPRLLPPPNPSSSSSRKGSRGAADGMLRPFLTIPDSDHSTMHPRSRSPSTSSQSSQGHHGHASDGGGGIAPPYRPSGRVQGMYDPRHPAPATTSSSSSRSAPPLNMNVNVRPSMTRGPSSASSSASGVSPGSAPASAGSHNGHGRHSAHAQAAGRVPSYGSGGSPPGSAHAESASSSSGGGGEGGAGGPSLAGLHIY